LIIANNVLAHVPDLNDFVEGIKILLGNNGIATLEFPHLLKLIKENQFDTIYHEHFCYFSFSTIEKVFAHHGLTLFDVELIPTHGGSLRIYACHAQSSRPIQNQVYELKDKERKEGLLNLDTYLSFNQQALQIKEKLLALLHYLKKEGKRIAAYGAPAKGNTLLNFCSIHSDLIEFTVDRSPHKQGKLLPGSHIPIYSPEKIQECKPDYIVILPWNIKEEIMDQLSFVKNWNCQFILPIPEPLITQPSSINVCL